MAGRKGGDGVFSCGHAGAPGSGHRELLRFLEEESDQLEGKNKAGIVCFITVLSEIVRMAAIK